MGDRPAWMKIKKYKAEGRRAELILSLGKKGKRDYWFPVSPSIYENFKTKIQESRASGLLYLQNYIRRYRDYAGKWPSKKYVEKNKLSSGNTFMEGIANEILRLFQEGSSEATIVAATGLPDSLVSRFLRVVGKLHYEST